MSKMDGHFPEDPLWYKDAVIYELHVKAFKDSNGDGIGDFKGLTQKLDYLEDIGVTAVWLLPFYPSPLRDDGYDIADYLNIHPNYGTMRDFKGFLREAHKRGMKVITELVLNHTSDQHLWFQKARTAKKDSRWRDYYVWSDTPEKYKDARIIFKDFEVSNWAWDPVAKSYYWHRFYSHQPDLNFENPDVQNAVQKVMDYWLEIGVDGLRLDAVPYLFEKEGTNCENLPDTYAFLKKLRANIDGRFGSRMLLAEANQWPEDAASYFGDADECHMAFHFPLMPRIFMSLWMEDRFPILDILDQTPHIPESCQWAVFLRNHDELTLEMVTDEERDYMYRVYARDPHARINLGIRRRLAPLLGNHRRRIEIMNFLLFSLPGTPIIYYGDEIGMGDNYYLGDRDGVRTPMQWSGDRNAGFSRANPQRLYLPVIIDPEYHYEAVNVENQERNHASLLWWMKRVIAMRKQFQAFGRGNIEFVSSDNPKVISFVRQYNGQAILVVVNLSRFSQVVKLDLARFAGYVPEEVFSRNRFPCIRESYYTLTLGFHDYFWFLLSKEPETLVSEKRHDPVELIIRGDLRRVFDDRNKERIEKEILPQYLKDCRWFGGKARRIQRTTIVENIILKTPLQDTRMLFLEVVYSEGLSDMYLVPLSFASKERSEKIMRESPKALICRVKNEEKEGILYDGVYDAGFRENLLLHMARRFTVKGMHGEVSGCPGNLLKSLNRTKTLPLTKSQVLQTEQSNTSFLYEDSLFLKLFRHIEEGINPDLEIGKFLTEKAGFTHIPSFAGAVEYRRTGCEPIVLGILQEFVPNEGDAWKYTLHSLELYYSNILTNMGELRETPKLSSSLPDIASSEPHPLLQEVIGGVYSEMIRLLGRRTGEVHLALSQDSTDSEFRPEPFSLLYQRSLYQSMQSLTKRILGLLQERLRGLPPETRDKAKKVLSMEDEIINRFSPLLKKKVSAMKIRIHGDYHLGQVLFTGNDFVIIDFEGEPARALSERRLKRSPLRDVAGMIRSFHYAAHMSLFKEASLRPEDIPPLEQWADLWYKGISGIFLRSYLDTVSDALFLPSQEEELNAMLQAFLMEKAVYELGYELNNRPDWIIIPIKGIEDLLEVER